jgi:hypothetical protein
MKRELVDFKVNLGGEDPELDELIRQTNKQYLKYLDEGRNTKYLIERFWFSIGRNFRKYCYSKDGIRYLFDRVPEAYKVEKYAYYWNPDH